ncbi:MAG: 5-deoxy-glucuronate isomerase [Proteobacteria bacterium]|nr:5-deoxy-glucuronate isomerase [Pseudomonadota bacterium]
MAVHLTEHRFGFGPGYTPITGLDEEEDNTGIAFGVLRLAPGEALAVAPEGETAWLLMAGRVSVGVAGGEERLARGSLFDEGPSALHVAAGEPVRLKAADEVELTVYAVANRRPFRPRLHRPAEVPDERRGAGQVGGTCLRLVRTIFDRSNAEPDADLVLGEVVTLPGRWSSYPPHHHPQPEIYHYRFAAPQGYGHAELGERVLKVRHYDTVKILAGLDHAQCAAPGYGMYYSWVIRHLPGDPYTVPEFAGEHRWTMEPNARYWRPRGTVGHDL